MEIELLEIRDFLAGYRPFNLLDAQQLDTLPGMLTSRYLRRDSKFPPTEESLLYIIRSGAVELLDAKGKLETKLSEGELYHAKCKTGQPGLNGLTSEDTLFYTLPCSELDKLRQTNPEFDKHFSDSLRQRMQQAVNSVRSETSMQTTRISDLIKRDPVTISPDATIQQAAQLMREHGISSLLIMEEQKLCGLMTDSDLRRCVAEATPIQDPVQRIMATKLVSIQKTQLLSEALIMMTRLNIHHLPVMDGDRVCGMMTSTDLARYQTTNSAYIAADLHQASTLDELVQACARLPQLQAQLATASATASHIGEAISHITDVLTQRLLQLVEERLGPPPVPYVWVVGGSQARREQTSHSDQDNALIISNDMKPEHDAYFSELATFVSDGLNACGFVYCPGDAMASNAHWRQPVKVWRQYFHDWIHRPQPKALMLASIFFDLRALYGDEALFAELQEYILTESKNNKIFIAYMVANALTHRPPLGFFRNFALIHDGKHDDTLDIKHRGIVPITDIARVYALMSGLSEINTSARLQAAAEAETLSEEMQENLCDALEFIASLRVRHQAEQIKTGKSPDNYLPPEDLSELERRHLKDAFKLIQTMQETLENRYQSGRMM
jgi:CBS domain-containing protein